MTAPRLTVAIPFFDEEQLLASAIRSILRQTFTDFELLLVDDGSRDRSLEIARSFGDPRIRVVSDGRRRHLPARLNEIANAARGQLVARMDADDVSHPDRLRRQVAVMTADGACDVVGTWVGIVVGHRPFTVGEANVPATPASALERGIIPHASMMARREWFLANPYDERLTRTDDRELWFRTASTTRFRVVDEPLYVVRHSPGDPRFVPNYIEGMRQYRSLLRRDGPATLGVARSLRLRLTSHAKVLAVRGVSALGSEEWLVARRGRPATPGERALIEQALAAAEP